MSFLKLSDKSLTSRISKLLPNRHYSSLKKAEKKSHVFELSEISRTKNDILVATVETESLLAYFAAVIHVGPRDETFQNRGIVHCLRRCSALSTANYSSFALTRTLEYYGSKLMVSSSREHLVYSLKCSRDHVDVGLQVLADVVCNPLFHPWEVCDAASTLGVDLAMQKTKPVSVLLENLHRVAFTGGLSNPLYSPEFMVGKHDSSMMSKFHSNYFVPPRTSLIGIGVEHSDLRQSVDDLFPKSISGNVAVPESKFIAGEIRIEDNLPFVHTAVVVEGSKYSDTKHVIALGLLQCLLADGQTNKYGGSRFTRLGVAAAKSVQSPFVIQTLNMNYSDTGLFGLYICGVPEDMTNLIFSAVSEMKQVARNITEDMMTKAKAQLKAKIRTELGSAKDITYKTIWEIAHFGRLRSIGEMEKIIDEIEFEYVSKKAAEILKVRPAMASIGPLHSTPYVEEMILEKLISSRIQSN